MVAIRSRLQEILPHVKNPGRYIGGEANQRVRLPGETLASMALVFPDVYEIGMSHNGTKVLYHLLNREPDLAAERAFAPMPDMAAELRRRGLPLYTLESYRSIASFEAIGISLQTELNYTNVPLVLELGGLQAFAADRAEGDPLVIGGGPCMANPEPVADFFDLFVIGDGEILAAQLLRRIGEGRRAGESKEAILRALAEFPGVYVPRFLKTVTSETGEAVPEQDFSQGPYLRAKGVKRVWVEALNRDDYPTRNVVPHMKLVHERFSVEVMRGCTQGCRFCQAGYWYRPNRELKADAVIDLAREGIAATGESELGLLSLSTADYGPAEKVLDALIENPDFENVNISLPSLRANSFGQGLAMKTAALGGGKSATFAPETGSERLRKLINKTISDKDMYEAAEGMFRNGFHTLKLYTMVGLPTEELSDMEAFCRLIENLARIGQRHGRRNTIHPNIGIMVPKPFTPMQWTGFMERDKVKRHIDYVRDRFRGNRNVRITWADYDLAEVETFYSRGDRSLSALIYEAYRRGNVFESFSEYFKAATWQAIWAEKGYDKSRLFRERGLEEVFPWDFIHAGTNKGYLKNEYRKMLKEDSAPVPDCKWGDCQKCGIPGNYADISLSRDPESHAAPGRSWREIKALAAARSEAKPKPQAYRLTYRKAGLSCFLAHQNTMDLFEKAFRRLGIDFAYTEGFHARPVMKNAGALPLGMASRRELLVLVLRADLAGREAEICRALSACLPEGMDVLGLEAAAHARMPHVEEVTYRLTPAEDGAFPSAADLARAAAEFDRKLAARREGRDEGAGFGLAEHRGKALDLLPSLASITLKEGELEARVRTYESGAGVSPYAVYAFLLGVEAESLRDKRVRKEDFRLAAGKAEARDQDPDEELRVDG